MDTDEKRMTAQPRAVAEVAVPGYLGYLNPGNCFQVVHPFLASWLDESAEAGSHGSGKEHVSTIALVNK